MISFKQWLFERHNTTVRKYTGTHGFYAWLNVAQDSLEDILNFIPELHINARQLADLHCTVMYSKTPVPVGKIDENKQLPDPRFIQEVGVKGITWWPGHKEQGVLVLLLDPTHIQHLHEKWKKLGAIPTYPDYTPHITLATDIEYTDKIKSLVENKMNEIDDNPFRITLIQEQVEDLS